ncbi:MAG: hypothetical protein WC497_01920 [Patescibacteria group bacterium]
MKEQFKAIFETRLFNALMGFVLFAMLAVGFDYATDEKFTTASFLFDLLYSLLLGVLIFIIPSRSTADTKKLRRHAEIAEMIGFILIGLLLFVAVLVLVILRAT